MVQFDKLYLVCIAGYCVHVCFNTYTGPKHNTHELDRSTIWQHYVETAHAHAATRWDVFSMVVFTVYVYTSCVEITPRCFVRNTRRVNTMIHVTNNTLVTQYKCYRMTPVSVECTRHIGVGTRYYMKCQYDA